MRHLAWIPALAVLRHHHKYSKKHKKTATQQANAHHVALILAANYVYFSEASPPHTKRGLPSPPSSVSLSHQFLWGKRDSNNTVPSTKYKHPPSFGSSRLCQSSDEWDSTTPPRAALPGATSATLDRSRRPLREIKTRAASGKCQPAPQAVLHSLKAPRFFFTSRITWVLDRFSGVISRTVAVILLTILSIEP